MATNAQRGLNYFLDLIYARSFSLYKCIQRNASCHEEDLMVAITEPHNMLVTPLLPLPGGSTRYERQADGPDKKKTGVHSSSPIKQICSWCLLVT